MNSKRVTIEKVNTKQILNKPAEKIDTWFWVKRGLNLYRGCEHNCRYCDGKAEYYRINNFGTHIQVKINAPSVLEKELRKEDYLPIKRKAGQTLWEYMEAPISEQKSSQIKPKFLIGLGGGVCDVYQPAEEELRISRKLLQVIRDFDFPVWILTKNKLVLRDLDILEEINQQSYAQVNFSITLADPELQKLFEPGSSTTQERFDALRIIRSREIHGGVCAMPLLPGLGDTEENIRVLAIKAKEVSAEFFMPAGLTLKPVRQKKEFMNVIKTHFPNLVPLYESIYKSNSPYGHPDISKTRNVAQIGHKICYELGLPDRIPRFIPDGYITSNLEIGEKLFEIAYLIRWVYLRSYKKSKSFSEAGYILENLDKDIKDLYQIGRLSDIKGISRSVQNVIKEIIESGTSQYLENLRRGHLNENC
ncbi:MAG: radical SAM protein [Promethearchaeota archaeon]